MHRHRTSIPQPIWDNIIDVWTKQFYWKNKWRCKPYLDESDLVQEGKLLFLRLLERYPDIFEQRRMMALYKNSYRNWLYTQGCFYPYYGPSELQIIPIDLLSDRIGDTTNAGYLAAHLAKMPLELQVVVDKLLEPSVPQNTKPVGKNPKPRSHINKRLRRELKLTVSTDPTGWLHRYLGFKT